MIAKDRREKLSPLTILLHWSIAVLFGLVFLFGAPLDHLSEGSEKSVLLYKHMTLGLSLLAMGVVRGLWRSANGMPVPLKPYTRFTGALSKVARWGMISLTIAMPLIGIWVTLTKGYGINFLGVALMPAAASPLNAVVFPQRVHQVGAWVFVGFFALHLAAGLRAAIVTRDGSLQRMFGAAIPRQP